MFYSDRARLLGR